MQDQATIWRRRVALMAAIGLLLAIPLTIAIRGGDDPDSGETTVAAPEVGGLEFDRDVGVELRLPSGWTRKREGKAVVYRSAARDVLIAISAPGPVEDAEQIQDAALAAVKSKYEAAEVVDRVKRRKLGGRPAETAAILARHPKNGKPIRILVSTARGEDFAYLTEVFAAGSDPSDALVEAQALLNNLQLEG